MVRHACSLEVRIISGCCDILTNGLKLLLVEINLGRFKGDRKHDQRWQFGIYDIVKAILMIIISREHKMMTVSH